MRILGRGELLHLFARSRQAGALLTVLLVFLVVIAFVPRGFSPVPYRDTVQVALGTVFGLAPALFVARCLSNPMQDLEVFSKKWIIRALRGIWYSGITGALIVICWLAPLVAQLVLPAGEYSAASSLVLSRNMLVVMATAWLGSKLFSVNYSWIPGGLLVMLVWIFGTTDFNGTHAVWAIPNYPAQSGVAAIVSAALWIVAGTLYVQNDRQIVR